MRSLGAAAHQHDNLTAFSSEINAEARTKIDSQFEHPATHWLAIPEISRSGSNQSGRNDRLCPNILQRIKPLVKRDAATFQLELANISFDRLNGNVKICA